MKILYCKKCGKPYGTRSKNITEAFTPESRKLREKFRKMEHCDCNNEDGWEN